MHLTRHARLGRIRVGMAARALLLMAGYLLALFGIEWRSAASLETRVVLARELALRGTAPEVAASEFNALKAGATALEPVGRTNQPNEVVAKGLAVLLAQEPLASKLAGATRSSAGLRSPGIMSSLAEQVLVAASASFRAGDPVLACRRVRHALETSWAADGRDLDLARIRCLHQAEHLHWVLDDLEIDSADAPILQQELDPWLARLSSVAMTREVLVGLVPGQRLKTRPLALFQRSANARATLWEWERVEQLCRETALPFDATKRDPGGRLYPHAKSSLRYRGGGLGGVELAALELRRGAAFARVVLAARAFETLNGERPARLEDLGPLLPDGVPIDPAMGKAFVTVLKDGTIEALHGDAVLASSTGIPPHRGVRWAASRGSGVAPLLAALNQEL